MRPFLILLQPSYNVTGYSSSSSFNLSLSSMTYVIMIAIAIENMPLCLGIRMILWISYWILLQYCSVWVNISNSLPKLWNNRLLGKILWCSNQVSLCIHLEEYLFWNFVANIILTYDSICDLYCASLVILRTPFLLFLNKWVDCRKIGKLNYNESQLQLLAMKASPLMFWINHFMIQ